MAKQAAGILLYRQPGNAVEVLLVHPGGPFWAGKELGAWSIPKGEFGPDEEPLAAARREFEEETGSAPQGQFIELDPVRQPGGKVVHAWALLGDFDPRNLHSNSFAMHWPPRSGRQQTFPEVDRAAWFDLDTARTRIHRGQVVLLDQLCERIGARSEAAPPGAVSVR